ncbi:carboxymuconolactone decarboxylase family protein [Nonomuraea angiospora]|uniref:Alkylhydroperoxidase/carboxymuconolactone decarboxylase family protein YurZ n=1 Tax=Nonomuraea angiospora TaxID=46172 RepID=A0ABR9LQK2_9ACTN|nr:carboxymuconolactone decarboxylase family protein [Nonomuraea angiospora]MBE1582919.1 alkylhydroperoxidase/carboxymuconolactone decarboxylase family protein YurZ [Nonomuraea angiospora]
MNVHAKTLDPVFAQMSEATDRKVWEEITELSTREKVLLSLVGDVCQQTLGLPFEAHVTMAYENGLSADDLRELLRFIAYDSGYPAALSALARLVDIEREQGRPGPTGDGHPIDADGQSSPIPAPTRQAVRNLDPVFADFMDLQSRMRAGMRRLTGRERAFATMTVDVLFQTLEESFRVHVTRALKAGATPEEVRAVVRFSAQFGLTKAWRGMRALNDLFTEAGTVFA